MNLPDPVGYHCDHSDEPLNERTHHDWEWVEGEGFVFQHQPDTISSHTGTQKYLKPEQRERRCPRAVAMYPVAVLEAAVRDQVEQARRIAVQLENENARLTAELAESRASYEGMVETAERIESQAIRQRAHLTARVEEVEADNAALTDRLLALQNANEGAYKAAYDATGGPHFDTAQPFGATT